MPTVTVPPLWVNDPWAKSCKPSTSPWAKETVDVPEAVNEAMAPFLPPMMAAPLTLNVPAESW